MIAFSIFTLFLISLASAANVKRIGPQVGQNTLTVPPENDAVYEGDTVVFTSHAHSSPPIVRIMWGEFITNPLGSIISDNDYILSHPNAARYRILHTQAHIFDLEIRNVTRGDAGRYLCQNTLAGPPDTYRMEIELMVMASTPVCNSTAPPGNAVLEGQTQTIECRVEYSGIYPPQMSWSGPDGFIVANPPATPTTVWSGIQYVVNRTMDLRAFECLTNSTTVPAQPSGIADNTPTFSHLYRSPQMFVYWGPKNLFVTPNQPTYQVGDVLTCHADAFPEATYLWQNMRTLELFYDTQTFTITANLFDTNQTMRCQASNSIQGFVYSENYFHPTHVPAPPTTVTPTTPPSTTTAVPFSDCQDLTGYWVSDDPRAELIITVVPGGQVGEVVGLIKNRTDTVWVEVIGTTRKPDYAYVGLTAIWPVDAGLTGFSGECHNCYGDESIIGNGFWRAYADSAVCGHGGSPYPYDPYSFKRRGSLASLQNSGVEYDVYKPTHISNRLGLALKKK